MYSYSPFDNLHDIHQQTENLTCISYLWEMWHRRSDTLHITVIWDSSDKQHVVYIYSFVFYTLLQSQRWQKIYSRLVEILLGVPFENILQVQLSFITE